MVLVIEGEITKRRARGSNLHAGMSDPKHDRDSDRESLTDWTLVDKDETPEDTSVDDPSHEENAAAEGEIEEDKDAEEESGCAMEDDENEEEEDEEALPEELISMGQKVQEIKEEGDIESLASTDISVLEPEKEKLVDEETDLSLASSPSLPDDLPGIKPDTQYRHTRDREFNSRLNVVVALTLACVIGLGLGHFLGLVALSVDGESQGWSSRTVWQESLNTAQIIEALNLENENLESEIIRLQQENSAPINIHGKDGKYARDLRERINHLIVDNEELRFAVGKLKFATLPEGNTNTFSSALEKNYNLRLAVSKLTHLVPDLNALRVSANDLQAENQELQIQVGKLRYQQQPLPQELNAVARELEKFKKIVFEASQRKKVPPNLDSAKTYISYMSQILSAFHTWHEFEEGNVAEKIDIATDVFEDLVPKNIKLSSPIQEKVDGVRLIFSKIRASLAGNWKKLKELSHPGKVAAPSSDSLTKMKRVIVNVVNKMKEIGQANIMKRGKAPLEKTINAMRERFTALSLQFDKTWKNLEAEVFANSEDGEVTTGDHDETLDDKTPEEFNAVNTDGDKELEIVKEEEDEVVETVDEELIETEALEEEIVKIKTEEEEVQTSFMEEIVVKAETEKVVVVDSVAKEEALVGSHESKMPSTDAIKSQEEGEGRRGGGDKKKLPDGKKDKKSKEKEKEENEDGKQHRSRRTRISEKEKKKEKREAQKKEKETQKKRKMEEKQNRKDRKQKEKHNAKSKDKHHRHADKQNHKQNHRNERNQKVKKHANHLYYKGQYNNDKNYWSDDDDDDDDDDEHRYIGKNTKRKHDDDDDDRRKYTKHVENDQRRGLMRHWEKSPKKNHRREYSGPKKAFIRRHGKNQTRHDGDWSHKRAAGREHKRKEEQKSDWLFQRAKNRRSMRESERKADWLFSRAQGRKEMRYHDEYEADKFEEHDKYGHNKYEKHETRRRYVRFEDDDDDEEDDDDDGDNYHYQQERLRGEQGYYEYPKKKGQREWVIPNFSATGKTYYR